jgi:hypothetical protein
LTLLKSFQPKSGNAEFVDDLTDDDLSVSQEGLHKRNKAVKFYGPILGGFGGLVLVVILICTLHETLKARKKMAREERAQKRQSRGMLRLCREHGELRRGDREQAIFLVRRLRFATNSDHVVRQV